MLASPHQLDLRTGELFLYSVQRGVRIVSGHRIAPVDRDQIVARHLRQAQQRRQHVSRLTPGRDELPVEQADHLSLCHVSSIHPGVALGQAHFSGPDGGYGALHLGDVLVYGSSVDERE